MGNLLGRNRKLQNDPFYTPVPPLEAPPTAYDPTAGLNSYGPGEEYFSYKPTTSIQNLYGSPMPRLSTNMGGRYAQGLNQAPGIPPWNYGNYYLGNTTMQMMPFMLNKVAKFAQLQAMSALGNAGFLGSSPMPLNMSMMPNMSCGALPSYYNSMAAPMAAAAAPLPVAFSPLVQGMYPMASMCPANWMNPSSFMSALTSGPMPYRPPAYEFPSNVGMVMAVPYGTPNPMLSSAQYGSSQSVNPSSSWHCYCYSMPYTPATSSVVSYYPQSASATQSYSAYAAQPRSTFAAQPCSGFAAQPCSGFAAQPCSGFAAQPCSGFAAQPCSGFAAQPCSASISYSSPISNFQQLPFVQTATTVFPPVLSSHNQPISIINEAPLWTSQGAITSSGYSQPPVMASNHNTSISAVLDSHAAKSSLPVYSAMDQSQLLIGRPVTPNHANLEQHFNERSAVATPSTVKYENKKHRKHEDTSKYVYHLPSAPRSSNLEFTRSQPRRDPVLPPILNGHLISDTGWLPKHSETEIIPSAASRKKRKRLRNTDEHGKSGSNSFSSRVSFRARRQSKSSGSSISEYECAICQREREKQHLRDHYDSSTLSSLLSTKDTNHHQPQSMNEFRTSSKTHASPSLKPKGQKSHRRHPKNIKKSPKISSRKSNSPDILYKSPSPDESDHMILHEDNDHDKENSLPRHDHDGDYLDDRHTEKSDIHASQTSLKSDDE